MFVYDYIHKKETGEGAEKVTATVHDLWLKNGDPSSLPVFTGVAPDLTPSTTELLSDLYNTYNYIYNISYWDAEANKTVTKVYAEKIEVGKPFVPSRTATGEIDTTKATEIEWTYDGIRIVPNPIIEVDTETDTEADTNPDTDSATDPEGDPNTDPTTDPESDPSIDPDTNPDTQQS